MKITFEHSEGKIVMVATTPVWGGSMVERYDVSESVMPVVDDYLDYHLFQESKQQD